MNARREYRALLSVVAVIGAVGVVSSVAGIADHIAAAVLTVAALGWLAVLVLRRERRIRARLADPRTRPAPRPAAAVPHTRVGPGDRAPVPPAPIHRPDGAAVAATTDTPDHSPAAAAGRPRTPTGGAS